MYSSLTQFAQYLRASGLPVGTSEVQLCLQALQHIDLCCETTVYCTLKTTLIKTTHDLETFDQCYEHFFKNVPPPQTYSSDLHTEVASFLEDPRVSESLNTPSFENIRSFLTEGELSILQQIQQIQQGQPSESNQGPSLFSGLQTLGERLEVQQAIRNWQQQLDAFFQRMLAQSSTIENQAQLYAEQGRIQEQLAFLRERLFAETTTLPTSTTSTPSTQQWQNQSVLSLNHADQLKMHKAIQRLIQKINEIRSRKFKRHSRHQIDLKRTLRKSPRTAGIPINLEYKTKKPHKGRLLILCDVSGSMVAMAHIFLRFVHAISQQFDHVQSFIFIEDLLEITPWFEELPATQAILKALEDPGLDRNARTNYGHMLRTFKKRHWQQLTTQTSVFILGDARNNGNATEHGILQQMKKRTRRVIWLNPEDRKYWNQGDSDTTIYAPACTDFRECRTFHQIEEWTRVFL